MLNINYNIISLETMEDALKAKRYFDKVSLNVKKVNFELDYNKESYWNDLFGTSNDTYNYNYSKLNYGNCIAFSFNGKIIILKDAPLSYKFTIDYMTKEFTCDKNVLVFDNINTNIVPVDSIQFKLRSAEDNDEMEWNDDNYPLKISYNGTNKISKGFERYINDFAEAFTDDFDGFKYYSDSVDYNRTINFNNFNKELFSVSEYYPSSDDDYTDDDDYGYYDDYDYEYSALILCGDVYLSLFEINMDDLELDLKNSNDEVYKLKIPIMLKIETPEDLIYRNYIVENIYKSNINEETNTVYNCGYNGIECIGGSFDNKIINNECYNGCSSNGKSNYFIGNIFKNGSKLLIQGQDKSQNNIHYNGNIIDINGLKESTIKYDNRPTDNISIKNSECIDAVINNIPCFYNDDSSKKYITITLDNLKKCNIEYSFNSEAQIAYRIMTNMEDCTINADNIIFWINGNSSCNKRCIYNATDRIRISNGSVVSNTINKNIENEYNCKELNQSVISSTIENAYIIYERCIFNFETVTEIGSSWNKGIILKFVDCTFNSKITSNYEIPGFKNTTSTTFLNCKFFNCDLKSDTKSAENVTITNCELFNFNF